MNDNVKSLEMKFSNDDEISSDTGFIYEKEIGKYELNGPKYLLMINVTEYKNRNPRKSGHLDEQLIKTKFHELGFRFELPGIKLELTGEFFIIDYNL